MKPKEMQGKLNTIMCRMAGQANRIQVLKMKLAEAEKEMAELAQQTRDIEGKKRKEV